MIHTESSASSLDGRDARPPCIQFVVGNRLLRRDLRRPPRLDPIQRMPQRLCRIFSGS